MPRHPCGGGRAAACPLAIWLLAVLVPASAWALHKESPPAYRITGGASHFHPSTRSWGNYFAFSSPEDLAGTGSTSRQIFYFNLAFFDCFNGTTLPTTPCPNPLLPFLVQATFGPGAPDNPSLALPADVNADGVDDNQWLAFDARGDFNGGTGAAAGHRQIFLKNLITNEVRQITFGVDGDSVRPSLSNLGGLVVFESTARLSNVPSPAGVSQIYAYETNNRFLRQVTAGAGPSTRPMTNNGGALIAFQSTANLLGDGADSGVSQIFWAEYDRRAHTATVHQLTRGNAPSQHPYITELNSFIAFDSLATNLPGTLGGVGSSVYISTPLTATAPQPPVLQQLTEPAGYGNCTYPMVDAGSVAEHIGFVCDGDPLGNATVGNRVFVFERSTLTLFQVTGSGDVQPPIGGNLGSWFLTLATTSPLTGQGACGYQLYMVDYLPGKWAAATQRGELPPDALTPTGTSIIGARTFQVVPGDALGGSHVAITTTAGTATGDLPDDGKVRLVIGAPEESSKQAAVKVSAADTALPPIPVAGIGRVCLKMRADGGGTIDCNGVEPGGDVNVSQDHVTDDSNPLCLAPDCRENESCPGHFLSGPHQSLCPVCLVGTCSSGPYAGQACTSDEACHGALACENGTVPTCNGALIEDPVGTYAAGGMSITLPVSVGVSIGAGGNGKFCDDDDTYSAVRSFPMNLLLTTGAANASIADADAVAGALLTVPDTGAPFDCNRLRAGDLGGARLVGMLPLLDIPNIPTLHDLVLSVALEAAPPNDACTSNPPCLSNADCNDGNPCNGGETCVSNGCVAGPPLACDDGDPCNGVETCDPTTGACLASLPCDDGDPCNGVETCDPTGCHPGTPIVCSDADACNGVETCTPVGTCLPGTPPVCDDGSPCTADSCDAGAGCVHVPLTGPCDDANACTTGDTCQGGACVGAQTACDDGNACNGVESCDPGSGLCQPGPPPTCDDANPCTDNLCDIAFGCLFVDNTLPCDDSSACTSADVCRNGSCRGIPLVCDDGDVCNGVESCDPLSGCQPAATPLACDDGNPCTTDLCDASLGCLHTNNAAPCDDGNACTAGDTCAAGACAGVPVVCDDGVFCNGAESCDAQSGLCQPGTAPPCDDSFLCTTDTCDPAQDQCVHLINALCLTARITGDVSQASPADVGGVRRQARLVARLTTVQFQIVKATADPPHSQRYYRRANRQLVGLKRGVRALMAHPNVDQKLLGTLLDTITQLIDETKRLATKP